MIPNRHFGWLPNSTVCFRSATCKWLHNCSNPTRRTNGGGTQLFIKSAGIIASRRGMSITYRTILIEGVSYPYVLNMWVLQDDSNFKPIDLTGWCSSTEQQRTQLWANLVFHSTRDRRFFSLSLTCKKRTVTFIARRLCQKFTIFVAVLVLLILNITLDKLVTILVS